MAMHLGANQAAAISEFGTRHGVQELAFFRSAIQDDFTPASDVDLLIDFAPGETPSLFGLVDMRDEVSVVHESPGAGLSSSASRVSTNCMRSSMRRTTTPMPTSRREAWHAHTFGIPRRIPGLTIPDLILL